MRTQSDDTRYVLSRGATGSLGIPRIGWLDKLGLQSRSIKEYMFFDTSLGNSVENAFQALALDEERAAFSPSIWEKPRGNTTVSHSVNLEATMETFL